MKTRLWVPAGALVFCGCIFLFLAKGKFHTTAAFLTLGLGATFALLAQIKTQRYNRDCEQRKKAIARWPDRFKTGPNDYN